jgi:hypothetical protein
LTNFTESSFDQMSSPDSFAPFTYSIVPINFQQLPTGLTLASEGEIGGTPTMPGTYTFTVKAVDTADGIASVQQFTKQIFAPTAATVSISGRVLTPEGRGLTNATVTLTGANGYSRTSRTSTIGYYRFDEVESGQTYIFTLNSKRYQFTPQVVTVMENLSDLNFTAQ